MLAFSTRAQNHPKVYSCASTTGASTTTGPRIPTGATTGDWVATIWEFVSSVVVRYGP
jgi:hypothetical protein